MGDPLVSSGVLTTTSPRLRRIVEWNPLEWSMTDRCLLVAWLMLPFSAGYWLLDEVALTWPRIAPYYDFVFLASFQRVLAGFVLAWMAVIALGPTMRRRAPRGERFFVWFTIQLYSIGNAVAAVVAGPVTTPHVIVLVGGVAVGFFLFEARAVLEGMLAAFLVLAAGAAAVVTGWMRYAPMLASPPYVEGHVSGWWIGVMGLVTAAASLALVVLFAYVTARLRDREKRLHDAARTDPLTGVSNRRRFLEVFEAELARAKRYGTSLSLVLLDLDHFKSINDTYGHTIGDRVLVAAAAAFQNELRAQDVLARWGGEEFVLLLPQTSSDGAQSVGERCRSELEIVELKVGDERVGVTVSVGVATYPSPHFDDADGLLRAADEALYLAKNRGRNRVVSIPPPAG